MRRPSAGESTTQASESTAPADESTAHAGKSTTPAGKSTTQAGDSTAQRASRLRRRANRPRTWANRSLKRASRPYWRPSRPPSGRTGCAGARLDPPAVSVRYSAAGAVLPLIGTGGMPSFRWSQERTRPGTTRTTTRLFIIASTIGRWSSEYGP